jgi:hypothetical protein
MIAARRCLQHKTSCPAIGGAVVQQPKLATFSIRPPPAIHVVYDQPGSHAAIIDPVLDYDAKSGRIQPQRPAIAGLSPPAADLQWILETMPMPTTCPPPPGYSRQAG